MTGSTRERNQLGKECFSNEFLLSLPLSKGELLRLVQTMDSGETVSTNHSRPGGLRSVISSSPSSLFPSSSFSAFAASPPPSLFSPSSRSSSPSPSVAEGDDKQVGESPGQRRGKRPKGSTSQSPRQSDSKRRKQGKREERIKPPLHQAEESPRTPTTTTMTLFERERQQHNALRKRRGLRQRRTSLTANEFDWVLGPEERRYLGRATQK